MEAMPRDTGREHLRHNVRIGNTRQEENFDVWQKNVRNIERQPVVKIMGKFSITSVEYRRKIQKNENYLDIS